MSKQHYKSLAAISLLALSLGYSTPNHASASVNVSAMSTTQTIISGSARHTTQEVREITQTEKDELKEKAILVTSALVITLAGLGIWVTSLERKRRKELEKDKPEYMTYPSP